MTDERGGRYFREARFFLAGDKVAAQSHILEARSLMGYMRDMHALGGPPIQVKYATLQDGTQIKATMMNGQYQAEIISPMVLAREVAEACRTFWSGLLSVEAVGHYERPAPDGAVEKYDAIEWLHPSEFELLGSPDLGPKIAVEAFAKPDMLRLSSHPDAMVATYATVYASAYSGAMRQAVQLFLGMGQELVKYYAEGLGIYEYNFGFDGTHGLVRKAEYTEEGPAFWLVRMPTAGRGLLAMDFPVCTSVSKAQQEAGVRWIPADITNFPEGAELDAAIESGKVIEAMPVAGLSALLTGCDPMYMDCGWAFSLSGHECQNVVYTVETVAPGDYRVYTKRIKVQFAVETVDGVSTISATVGESDKSLFFGGKNTLPRFPWITPTIWSLYPPEAPWAAPRPSFTGDQSVDCAVHVYYAGDDEQVFRYVVEDNSGETVTTGTYFEAVGYLAAATLCAGDYTGHINSNGSSTYYTLNGGAINSYTTSGDGTEYSYSVQGGGSPGNVPYAIISGGGLGYDTWATIQITESVGFSTYIRNYAARVNFAVLLVPFHQREAVYVLDAEKNPTDEYTVASGFLAHIGGTTWWELVGNPSDTCPSGRQVAAIRTHTVDQCYQVSPRVRVYTFALQGGGGVGIAQINGCFVDLGGLVAPPDPVPYVVPAATTWSGSLKFIGAGASVATSLGTSSAPDGDNVVRAKILAIMDTEYIDGSSMFIHGWTDGIKPDKYIAFTNINTVLGADAVTNTAYPISEMNAWGKSFVGIAN